MAKKENKVDFTKVKAKLMEKLNEAYAKATTDGKIALLYTYKDSVGKITSMDTLSDVYTLCKAFNSSSEDKKVSLSWKRENQKYAVMKTKVKLQEEGYSITYGGTDNGLCLKVRGYSCLISPTTEGKNVIRSTATKAEDCTEATAELYSVAGQATMDYLKKLRVEDWNLADKVSEYKFRLTKALVEALGL